MAFAASRKPDRRVAVGGSELEQPPRRKRAYQHRQQLGRIRLDVAPAPQTIRLSLIVGPAATVQAVEEFAERLVHQGLAGDCGGLATA